MAKQRILVEDPSQADDISEEDVLQYAKQIGIDVENEKHLLWIAQQGLQACVPYPWCPIEDEKGRVYYYNEETGQSIWEHPSDVLYRDLVVEERAFLRRNKSLSTTCSDPGFESKLPLDSLYGGKNMPAKLTKTPLPMLSSLADAPPLSSVGKIPASISRDTKINLSEKSLSNNKFNRMPESNRLAPMKLESLNISQASALNPLESKSSLFPKGTLAKKNKSVKQEVKFNHKNKDAGVKFSPANHFVKFDIEDNSDEGSQYSYEETDYEGEDFPDAEDGILDRFGLLDASQISPMLAADSSPEPMEVNSLVKLGMIASDSSMIVSQHTSKPKGKTYSNVGESFSVNSGKIEKANALKSITKHDAGFESNFNCYGQDTSLAVGNSSLKLKQQKVNRTPNKTLSVEKDDSGKSDSETDYAEARVKEKCKAKQEALEKEGILKLDKIKNEWAQKMKEEEAKLREEKENRIKNMKEKLDQEIELEETALKLSFDSLKKSNADKLFEEQERLDAELKDSLQLMEKELEKQKLEMQQNLDERKSAVIKEHQKNVEILKKGENNDHHDEEDIIKNTEEIKFLESQLKNLKELFEKEQEKFQKLTKDISALNQENISLQEEHKEIKAVIDEDGEILKELQEERTQVQKDVDELQGEMERMENDLDVLRNEKTQLFSELSTLKDKVNKEKSFPSKLHTKVETSEVKFSEKHTQVQPTLKHKQVNTDIESKDESCQVEIINPAVTLMDSIEEESSQRQTSESKITPLDPRPEKRHHQEPKQGTAAVENAVSAIDPSILPSDVLLEKSDVANQLNIEEILEKVMIKFDSRMNFVEGHVRSLEEKFNLKNQVNVPFHSDNKESNHQPESMSLHFPVSNEESYIHPIPHANFQNMSARAGPSHPGVLDAGINVLMPSDHIKSCDCELGDSCEILLSLKHSLHHMHQQMHQPFLPPWCKTSQSDSYAVNTIGNAEQLNNLHMKLKELQKKHHVSLLKHQLEQVDMGGTSLHNTKLPGSTFADGSSSYNADTNIGSKDFPSYYNNWMSNSIRGFEINEDPVERARQIVLREQERSRIQNDQFMNRRSGLLHGGYSVQQPKWSPHSLLQYPLNPMLSTSVNTTPLSFGSSAATSFDVQFRHYRPEVISERDIKGDLEAWMARIQSMHQKIRSHEKI